MPIPLSCSSWARQEPSAVCSHFLVLACHAPAPQDIEGIRKRAAFFGQDIWPVEALRDRQPRAPAALASQASTAAYAWEMAVVAALSMDDSRKRRLAMADGGYRSPSLLLAAGVAGCSESSWTRISHRDRISPEGTTLSRTDAPLVDDRLPRPADVRRGCRQRSWPAPYRSSRSKSQRWRAREHRSSEGSEPGRGPIFPQPATHSPTWP